jgi:hypothetical protein
MNASKVVRTIASATYGVGVTGSAAAVIIALFAGLASRVGIAALLVVAALGWWAIWGGLAWFCQRNAERLREEAENEAYSRPRTR